MASESDESFVPRHARHATVTPATTPEMRTSARPGTTASRKARRAAAATDAPRHRRAVRVPEGTIELTVDQPVPYLDSDLGELKGDEAPKPIPAPRFEGDVLAELPVTEDAMVPPAQAPAEGESSDDRSSDGQVGGSWQERETGADVSASRDASADAAGVARPAEATSETDASAATGATSASAQSPDAPAPWPDASSAPYAPAHSTRNADSDSSDETARIAPVPPAPAPAPGVQPAPGSAYEQASFHDIVGAQPQEEAPAPRTRKPLAWVLWIVIAVIVVALIVFLVVRGGGGSDAALGALALAVAPWSSRWSALPVLQAPCESERDPGEPLQ